MTSEEKRQQFKMLAADYGLKLTSEERPGAVTKRGTLSDHAVNRALDFGGDPSEMAAFARAAAEKFGPDIKQLIHTPVGFYENGKWKKTSDPDHNNHVHIAWGADSKGDPDLEAALAAQAKHHATDDPDLAAALHAQAKSQAAQHAGKAAQPVPAKSSAPSYKPNPNIPRDPTTGRVIDPSTGQPFPAPPRTIQIGGKSFNVDLPYDRVAAPTPGQIQYGQTLAGRLAAGGPQEKVARGAQRLINTVGAPLYPVRDLFNKFAEEQARVASGHGGYGKSSGTEQWDATLRALHRWAPWEKFKRGVVQGKATDLEFVQQLAKGDPKVKERLRKLGGPEMADFLLSFAVDVPTAHLQSIAVGGLSKGVKALKLGEKAVSAAERLPERGPLGYVRGEIVNRPAYQKAAKTFSTSHAVNEVTTREFADIAQEEKLLTKKNAKAGATVRVKNPVTGTHHSAFSEQVADYLEAGAPGSKHESPASVLDPILARAKGAKVPQKLVAAEEGAAAEAAALQSRLQQAGRTKGAAAVWDAIEHPRQVEAQIAESARTKGGAKVRELVAAGEQSHAQMLAQGRQALKGILNEADMHAAADAAALQQYNETTNALRQTLPQGELAEILSRMKQAGRDAVARAVEAGESAEEAARAAAQAAKEAAQARLEAVVAQGGAAGKARIQSLLAVRQQADAAEAASAQAAQAVLDRAVQGGRTAGKAAVQQGLAVADTTLTEAQAAGSGAGAQRVSDLIQGTAPSERGAVTENLRAIAQAKRAEELPKVKAATEALGINYDDVAHVGERYKALADHLGQRLVDLGLLSKPAYESLRGYYLPRLYMLKASRPKEAVALLGELEKRELITPETARILESELTPTGRFGLTPRRGGQDFTKAREIESYGERISPEVGRIAAPTATAPMSRYIASATRQIGEAEAMNALEEAGLARRVQKGQEPPPRSWKRLSGGEYDAHPGVARYLEVRARALKQPETAIGEVWRDVNKAMRRWWISSPRTAVNNAAGNFVLVRGALEVNGVHQTLPESFARYASDLKAYRQYRKVGKITDPYLKEALEQTDILSEGSGIIPHEAKAISGNYGVETFREKAGKTLPELAQFKHPVQEAYSQVAYQDIEKTSRFHLYKELRRAGKTVDEARDITQAAMIDYSNIGPAVRWAEQNNLSPFITFPLKAISQYANLAIRRPDMFLTFTGERTRNLFDQMADRIAEEHGKKGTAKADRLAGRVRMTDFPVPGQFDATGQQGYRRVPFAAPILQMGPVDPSAGVAETFLERLKAAAPLPRLAYELATNRNTFLDRPIVEPGTTPGSFGRPQDILSDPQVAKAYGMHALRTLLPQVSDAERIYHAATGTTAYMSRTAAKQSLESALEQAFLGASIPEGAADNDIERTLRGAGRLKTGKKNWAEFSRQVHQDLSSGKVPPNPDHVQYLQQFRRSKDLTEQFYALQKKLPDAILTDYTSGKDHEQLIKNYWSWFTALKNRFKELRVQEAAEARGGQ